MHFLQNVFEMTALTIISVINHYHINRLHLFWDILYNRCNITEYITKEIYTLSYVLSFCWGIVFDVTCGQWLTGRSDFDQRLARLPDQGTLRGWRIRVRRRSLTARPASSNILGRGQPMRWSCLIALTVKVWGWLWGSGTTSSARELYIH